LNRLLLQGQIAAAATRQTEGQTVIADCSTTRRKQRGKGFLLFTFEF